MKRTSLILATLAGCLSISQAASIFTPGDPIIGGVLNFAESEFVVGTVGTSPDTNNWPAAEPPSDLINGLIGGGGEKYLNFAAIDTGVIITPAFGPSIVDSMTLWVANDSPERDPASIEVYGSNAEISGPGPFSLSDFTLIVDEDLFLPLERNLTTSDEGGFGDELFGIGDGNAYTSYMIVFPTVEDEPFLANSMQLSEIQFYGIPEPGSMALLLSGLGFLAVRRKR